MSSPAKSHKKKRAAKKRGEKKRRASADPVPAAVLQPQLNRSGNQGGMTAGSQAVVAAKIKEMQDAKGGSNGKKLGDLIANMNARIVVGDTKVKCGNVVQYRASNTKTGEAGDYLLVVNAKIGAQYMAVDGPHVLMALFKDMGGVQFPGDYWICNRSDTGICTPFPRAPKGGILMKFTGLRPGLSDYTAFDRTQKNIKAASKRAKAKKDRGEKMNKGSTLCFCPRCVEHRGPCDCQAKGRTCQKVWCPHSHRYKY